LILTASGQSKNNLYGEWTIDITETINRMTPTERVMYDSLPDKSKQNVLSTFGGRSFTFNEDGTVQIKFKVNNNTRDMSGTWKLEEGVLIIDIQQNLNRYNMIWHTENEIELRPTNVSDNAVLKLLYLKRK
jgi:hypothetical protein